MDFCSYLWWIFVSTCMSLQIWEQWFALWPRFPDRSKKAYWLFSSNFYLWLGLSGDFQAPCVVDWKPEAPLLTFLTWSVLSLLHFALLIWKCKLIVFKSSKAYLLSPTAIITPAFLHWKHSFNQWTARKVHHYFLSEEVKHRYMLTADLSLAPPAVMGGMSVSP